MGKIRILFYVVTLIMIVVLTAACSPSIANNEPEDVVEEPVATAGSADTGGEETSTGGEEATATEELGAYGQPIDVPIMDGNRDLQISRSGENISYKIDDVTLQDVMTYYQDNLTEAGWTPGPNENPVGTRNLVTLARVNDAADRITVTMQFNGVGNFVVVSIVINRAP